MDSISISTYTSPYELWHSTLPYIIEPYKSESLFGYLLRLDFSNSFSPGTVLNFIKKHNTGILAFNRPGLFLCGTIFDLHKLSSLTGISYDKILELTLINLLNRIFGTESIHPELIGYSTHFKICPRCIKSYKLPLIHVFKNIDICIEHGLQLLGTCECGEKIILFQQNNEFYRCPKCNTPYENLTAKPIKKNSSEYKKQSYLYNAYNNMIHQEVSLIRENEDISKGFESRLQHISQSMNIKPGQFKKKFGYDASNLKNGLGLSNISLSKIISMLYELGYSPKAFSEIESSTSTNKIVDVTTNINVNNDSHTCPNIYCGYFNQTGKGNIKYYGKRTTRSGKILIEEYCSNCATRFIGNNIIQSYDYNPGVRQYEIDGARKRIKKWQNCLRNACKDFIVEKKPITLTGCFRKAKIPIGKTYFCNRLGLIDILIEYANKQREDYRSWALGLSNDEIRQFEESVIYFV